MNIEVSTKDHGLHGGREVEIKVQSDEILDWPRIEAKLDAETMEQLVALGPRTRFYFPDERTPEEKAEGVFAFEETWIWQQSATAGRWESESA